MWRARSKEDHGLLQEREWDDDLRDGDVGAIYVEAAGPRHTKPLERFDPRMDKKLNTYKLIIVQFKEFRGC
jgi:hypothetical protein